MRNKIRIIVIAIIVLIIGAGGYYFVYGKEDNVSTLTLAEQRWIENNKNHLIDLEVINDISILNYEGEGIVTDFLNELEEKTGLAFNRLSYEYGSKPLANYAIEMVDKVDENDILLYSDNYALFTNKNVKYNSIESIDEMTIGVLVKDIDEVTTYLDGSLVKLKSYDSYEDIKEDINNEILDGLVAPKLIYLSNIANNIDLYSSYNITEMPEIYVLSLGEDKTLNTIVRKYYKKWEKEQYDIAVNSYLSKIYFDIKDIDEKERVNFRSKSYIYGYIENLPYEGLVNDEFIGYNKVFIEEFAKAADIDVTYNKYDTVDSLINDFNSDKIDIFFNIYQDNEYATSSFQTVSPFDEDIVVLSSVDNTIVINSINSLKNEKIAVLKDTKIAEYLEKKDIDINEYQTVDKLLKAKENIIVMDSDSYNYYLSNGFINHKIDYQFTLNNEYNYIIRDNSANKLFINFLEFYLQFTSEKTIINEAYYSIINIDTNLYLIKKIAIYTGIIIAIVFIIISITKLISKLSKKSKTLSKEEKLKYVDMLTSLKNRNYLNDIMETWDSSEIYPQTIIIIDLNNIVYVNDNYGHQEGDNVIKEAANILIKNQMPNTDIIRTNGNEFLIYLVEYDEKQIISYTKKLTKEFKDLSHGFGAAIGYSMITDAIKTIDDAINEATIDMRNNKDELNNN